MAHNDGTAGQPRKRVEVIEGEVVRVDRLLTCDNTSCPAYGYSRDRDEYVRRSARAGAGD